MFAADEIHWTVTGPRSVTFDWRGGEDTIAFGQTTAYGNAVVAGSPNPRPFSSAGPFREAKITGLLEDRVYHYSIGGGPDHVFRTPPLPGTSGFNVAVEGDIGDSLSYSGMAAVQALVASRAPVFTLMVGDLTYAHSHGLSHVDQHYNDVMVWSQDVAYMPAWGNAEWDGPGHCSLSTSTACDLDADCPAGQSCAGVGDDLRNYKGRFDLPHAQTSPGSPALSCCGKDWSWFDYGNVRFIAYPEPWDKAVEDWEPKASALMDDAQADPALSFIVTFGHRPAYSSGHHPGETNLKQALDALGATHSKYVLNLNGHSHNYERSAPQSGVVHITAGTGGGSLEQDGSCLYRTCAQPSWSAFRAMHLGMLELSFVDGGIEGKFLCGPPGEGTNDVSCPIGGVIDAFTIGAPVTNPGLLAPADGTVYTGPVPPQPFLWSPGASHVFQVQFSASGDPFVPAVVGRRKFASGTTFTPGRKVWRKVRRLGGTGGPIYWRVLGRSGSSAPVASDQIFSFTLEP